MQTVNIVTTVKEPEAGETARITVRELDLSFIPEILPAEEYAFHVRVRKDFPEQPFEVTVEHSSGVAYVGLALTLEEIEGLARRAKERIALALADARGKTNPPSSPASS